MSSGSLWRIFRNTVRSTPGQSRPSTLLILSLLWITLSSAAKLSSIRSHRPHLHPGHLASHIVPLTSHTVGDPLAFLEHVNKQSQEKKVRFVVHRRRSDEDNEPETAFLELGPDDVNTAIIPMRELIHSHFVGPVKIGTPPQTMYLIYDTGSTNVQVVATACRDDTCIKVPRFNPSMSSTFRQIHPDIKLDITFGTGRIHSQLGTDVLAIGPYQVDNQTIGLIDHESGTAGKSNVFARIDFQGIVGFGFPELASAKRTPFFDNIMRSGQKANEFAIYMGRPDPAVNSPRNISSAFFIGGVDPRFYEGEIQMVPVVREYYWEVGLDSFWVGDVKFCCEEGVKNYVIIDSGTSFNTLPYEEVEKFRALVPKVPCTEDTDKDSVAATFPTLTYKLTGGVDVVITPDMYVISRNDFCEPAFMQIDVMPEFGHAYILGSIPYMRHYFTLFHRGQNGPSMIGIARSKHSTEGISFLESLE